MFKNTEKYERKTAQGSTAITQAMSEAKNADEDVLVAKTKQIYSKVSPPNDNSQLNQYLSPPYTTKNGKR
tara:strand:- start:54 stop:263 length:210 start_codon:yes stop_codon:yes gene_type:complete